MSRRKGLPKTGGRVNTIDKIRRLMSDPKVPAGVQLAAAQTLLDRAWGKPAQAIGVMTLNPLAHLSDQELH